MTMTARAERRPIGEAGFTLLETLVALAIVAIALGAAYAGFASGARATHRAETALEALTRAESALALVGAEIPLTEGETVRRDGVWTMTVAIAPHRPGAAYAWAPLGLRPLMVRAEARAEGGAAVRLETLRLGAAE